MKNFYESWLDKWDRIVVFGGVFDPVHKGHISAAKSALREGRKVYFAPERVPQHKHGTISYEHRKKMLDIATNQEKNFEVLDYPEEHQMVGPFFTWLAEKVGHERFVWLVGSDVLEHMSTWKDIEKLSEYGVKKVIYLPRERDSKETMQLPGGIISHAIRRPRWRNTRTTHAKMNSTAIRNNLESLHTQLPDGVYDYVKHHKLYS